MNLGKSSLLAAIAAASLSGGALAATVDGSLGVAGASSTGTVDINLTVPDLVRVSNLNAITMADSGTDYAGSDAVCVYRNGTGNYSITADSASGTGVFQVANGASNIDYTVDWGGSALAEATALNTTGANTTSQSCSGGTNLTVTVNATYEEVSGATTIGAHTDVLTLTVAPL